MPKRGQHDKSPGDDRQPYSDQGGPAGRHAQTHDVRREAFTNPKGLDRGPDEFADDIAPATPSLELSGHADESVSAVEDKSLHERLPQLDNAELARLPVLQTGTRLEQGHTYLDLNDLRRGPFKAIGGQEAGKQHRYIAKTDVDYELWNELAGDREPEIERPMVRTED